MTNNTTLSKSMQRAARQAPYLERDEEHDLAVAWKERKDQDAHHRLTQSHMRLVIAIANKFRNYGLPIGDLVQEGHVGLLEAAARFDPDRNVRFSTYAIWWIKASIQDYVLRNWSIVRGGTSSKQKSLFFNLRQLRARITRENRDLSDVMVHEQIAQAVGVSTADAAVMDRRLSSPDLSMSAPVSSGDGDSNTTQQDLFESELPLPDELAMGAIDDERRRKWLRDALVSLSDRERFIVVKRRMADDPNTLECLGERLGISKERVRQIENRALEKLRGRLLQQHGDAHAWVG